MKILIVEDENVAARGLERMVRNILGPKIDSLQIQKSLFAAETYLEDHPVDLLLLDLNLNGEDGFKLLNDIVSGSFHTIIVSANTDRALEAFDYGVLDFVPKPVQEERLRMAFERFEKSNSIRRNHARYISVRKEETAHLIPLDRVLYFQSRDNYVDILLISGETERNRKTLDSLELVLPPNFIRIHRSYIINTDKIEGFEKESGGKYHVKLNGNRNIPVSRNKYKELKDRFW